MELSSLFWPAVAVYAIWRLAPVAERFAPGGVQPLPVKREDEPMPPDLIAFAMQESEQWARDEARDLVRRKFVEYGDWNLVRRAVGVGSRG